MFFFNGEKNIVRSAISWFTRSPHYHVNIAFWMQGREGTERLMLAESQPGGFRLINLGFCRDRTMTVFERPVDWGLIRDTVVGTPGGVSYDFLDLFLIGMHERFGTPIPAAWTGTGEVCSVLISKILRPAEMPLDVIASPATCIINSLKINLSLIW